MISIFRRLSQSIFGRSILMILVAGMAFWGASSGVAMFQQGTSGGLASVNGLSLERSILDRRVETYLNSVNQEATEPVTKADALEKGIIDQIFEIEKSKLAALGYAKSIGLSTSATAVVQELKTIDAFRNPLTGELDPEKYSRVLRENNLTEAAFEKEMSDELALNKLRGAAMSAVHPAQVFAKIEARYSGEQREVAFFVLDTSNVPQPAAPTEAEVQEHYNKNLDVLKQPERRIIDLVQLSVDDFLHEAPVTDQEIATTYEAKKSTEFSEPEQRTYVEFRFADREAAKVAFGQLSAGADADSIKGVVSSETLSGQADSIADPTMRDALFGAGKQSGALYGPRDENGTWVVARLISIQPGAVKPIEEVRESIREALASERAKVKIYEKIEALDRAMAAGLPIEQIAAEAGVPLMTYQAVDKQGSTETGLPVFSLMSVEGALTEAFTLAAGETSGVITLPEGAALISVRKIVPAFTPTFDTVKDRVRAALIAERNAKAKQTYAQGYVDRIKSGAATIDAVAKEVKATVEKPAPITRLTAQESGLPGAALGRVFSGLAGEVFSFEGRDGNIFLIVQLKDVKVPPEAELAALASAATSSLTTALSQDMQFVMEAELAKSSKVRVNKNGLALYKAGIAEPQ